MQLVADDRLFAGGFKARVQLALKSPAMSAVINSIAVQPATAVPEPVLQLAGAGVPEKRQDPAWAGARQVDTYYALFNEKGLEVAYYDKDNQVHRCPAENLLDCAGGAKVIELNANGDTTHTLDLTLAYRDTAVTGISVVVSYAIDGADGVAKAQTLYVYN